MADVLIDPRTGSFKDWTDRYRAENEYIKALGEYKLNEAHAALEKANADKKQKEVDLWTALINQLDRDFRRYNNSQQQIDAQIKRIEIRSRNASLLLKGAPMDGTALSNAWSSYKLFEKDVLDSGAESLFDLKVPGSARKANNFVNNNRADPSVADVPSEVENGIQLMAWLKSKKYVAVSGSAAQRTIVKMFAAINELAANSVAEMNKRIERIRNGTFDAWNPKALLGASSDTAKKIEEAKPKV